MSGWKLHPEFNTYFITSSITEWSKIFVDETYFSVIANNLSYCKEHKDLILHAYVIMLDHIHLIATTSKSYQMAEIMRDFKSYTSKEIRKQLLKEKREGILSTFSQAAEIENRGNEFKIWQDGYHPIAIKSRNFFREKLNYIHQNPVKKGFVLRPEYWNYSSARAYQEHDESKSLIEIEILNC